MIYILGESNNKRDIPWQGGNRRHCLRHWSVPALSQSHTSGRNVSLIRNKSYAIITATC